VLPGMGAGILVWFGVIGVAVAAMNILALRTIRIEDVPRCVQGRIRWWSAHNSAFLLGSAGLVVVGLGVLVLA
jgi:hypothetical protein